MWSPHNKKLRLLSDHRTRVLSFSLNLHRQLSIRRFFLPLLVRLWLCKGSYFQLTFACLTAIFIPTRSYIIQFHHAPVHSFIHQSHLNTKSIMKYPQVTSCVQKRFKKQCKNVSKFNCLQPQRLEKLVSIILIRANLATLGILIEFHLKVIQVLYL
jgi:hypothetical protein